MNTFQFLLNQYHKFQNENPVEYQELINNSDLHLIVTNNHLIRIYVDEKREFYIRNYPIQPDNTAFYLCGFIYEFGYQSMNGSYIYKLTSTSEEVFKLSLQQRTFIDNIVCRLFGIKIYPDYKATTWTIQKEML